MRWTRLSYVVATLQQVSQSNFWSTAIRMVTFQLMPENRFDGRTASHNYTCQRYLEDDGDDAKEAAAMHQNDVIAFRIEKDNDDG